MAVLYKIKLSDVSKMSNVQKSERDTSLLTVHDIEIMVLDALFSAAAGKQSELKKMNQCYDCIEQVKNLDDKKEFIELTKTDLDFLDEGLKASVDRRPPFWFWAIDMFRSIEKKEEVEK